MTPFDLGVAALVLISALLATARGLTREVLSLVTWAGSAALAIWMWQYHPEIARGYIEEPVIADAVTVVVTLIIALIVLHLITMRVADFVVDSKIGPLDRTLGFVFGALRGLLIAVIVVVFGLWLLGTSLPPWAEGSRSLPMLSSLGDSLITALPPDLEQQITDILQDDEAAADESPQEGTEVTPEGGTDAGESAAPADAEA